MEKHLKKIIIGLVALCALLAGALIYREIDARRVPPLALESIRYDKLRKKKKEDMKTAAW